MTSTKDETPTETCRCANCGADTNVPDGIAVIVCSVCGHRFPPPLSEWTS